MTTDWRDARARAGIPEREPDAAERAYLARAAERGKPYGLTAYQVDMADRGGISLDKYKAMKGVRSPEDYLRILRGERG